MRQRLLLGALIALATTACHVDGDALVGDDDRYSDGDYSTSVSSTAIECSDPSVVVSTTLSTCSAPTRGFARVRIEADASLSVWVNPMDDGKFPVLSSLFYTHGPFNGEGKELNVAMRCDPVPSSTEGLHRCVTMVPLSVSPARTDQRDEVYYFLSAQLTNPECGSVTRYSLERPRDCGTWWATDQGIGVNGPVFPSFFERSGAKP